MTLFGGKSAWWKFVNDNNLSFFSDSTEANTIITVCHPEYLYNPRYLNWTHWYYALLHDRLYTELGRFMDMGDDYVCTVGRDIANKNGGTAAYMLLLQIENERRARNGVRQSKLYEEGNHNFQNSAREKLEKKGIYPVPGEDANRLYQQVLMRAITTFSCSHSRSSRNVEGMSSKGRVQSASSRENKRRRARILFKSTQRRNSRNVEGMSSKGRVQSAST